MISTASTIHWTLVLDQVSRTLVGEAPPPSATKLEAQHLACGWHQCWFVPMRILVVEDGPLLPRQIVTALNGSGHEAEGGTDGAAWLSRIGIEMSDFVALDINLPGVDSAPLTPSPWRTIRPTSEATSYQETELAFDAIGTCDTIA